MQSSSSRSTRLKRRVSRLVGILARPNTYTVILLAMVVLLALGTILVWILEQGTTSTPGLQSPDDAFVFMLQNVSGVGIGANAPHSPAARYLGVTIVILAAAMRAIFVAAVVSSFVNRLILQGKGVRRVDLEKHVIICGWNPRVKQIVRTLERDAVQTKVPVVLLAQISENPLTEFGVKFVKGDPSSAEDLSRAGAANARSAIVITDESDGLPHTDSTYDARGVLMVLALKSVNPNLHVVAEVRDPTNRRHFQHARADEVVVSAEVSEGVVARAATNQGIAWVYENLLRLDTEPEMYIISPPPEITGKSFQAALVRMNTRDNYILLGVVENSKVVMCPPNDHTIGPDTRLVVLGNLHTAIDR